MRRPSADTAAAPAASAPTRVVTDSCHSRCTAAAAATAHLHMQVLEAQLVLCLHGQLRHLLLQLSHMCTALLQLSLADQHLLRPGQLFLQSASMQFGAAETASKHAQPGWSPDVCALCRQGWQSLTCTVWTAAGLSLASHSGSDSPSPPGPYGLLACCCLVLTLASSLSRMSMSTTLPSSPALTSRQSS